MHSKLGLLLKLGKSLPNRDVLSAAFGNAIPSLFDSFAAARHFDAANRVGRNFSFVQRRRFCRGYAVEQFSDDEYECEFENHKPSSSVANIDEWRWKLSMLLRSEDQEIVSKDKRDRRDFEQIANLANRMGLYSQLYGKVVVASKVPLPNYRPDLDDKRPQREVILPLSLQRRVEGLLQEHVDRTQLSSGKVRNNLHDGSVINQMENTNAEENQDPLPDASVMEKILQRKSLRMRNLQRAWQTTSMQLPRSDTSQATRRRSDLLLSSLSKELLKCCLLLP